ncbi:hypothetical protein BOTBODRAFT_104879, partial [Botryobasidium botryosum FD-172 SS1]
MDSQSSQERASQPAGQRRQHSGSTSSSSSANGLQSQGQSNENGVGLTSTSSASAALSTSTSTTLAPPNPSINVSSVPSSSTLAPPAPTPSTSSAPTPFPIPSSPPTLFSALRSLFLHISTHPNATGKVSPGSFIDRLKKENEVFRSSMHQDAHEFLNFLLNKVVEDLEGEFASPHTLVHDIFEGVLTNETRCLTCEIVTSRDESFLDLSIDIEQNSSVTSCLRQFSASETLCHRNKFFCDSCCGLQEAERRMKIKKLPNVLALHLKRFKLQPQEHKYVKLSYRVAFPLELRLFNTVDGVENPDRMYRLFAIVVHIGGGPHHGHYVTIVRSRNNWVIFDDDTVDTIKESDIPKYFGDSSSTAGGSGYVLFYQA